MPTSSSSTATGDAAKLQLNLQDMISDLFLVLTEKEREVIKRRFSLSGQNRQTLEKIGKHFNVTRERVRQIESIALSKLRRTVGTTKLDEVNQMAKGILRANGGVMLEDNLIGAVLKRLPKAMNPSARRSESGACATSWREVALRGSVALYDFRPYRRG